MFLYIAKIMKMNELRKGSVLMVKDYLKNRVFCAYFNSFHALFGEYLKAVGKYIRMLAATQR